MSLNGWKKIDPAEAMASTNDLNGWSKVDPIAEAKAAPVKPVQQDVERVIAPTNYSWDPVARDEAKPLSDEDASLYVQMTKNPDIHPEDIGNWLEEKGYVWTPQAAQELATFREQIARGATPRDEVGYRSAAGEILGPQGFDLDTGVGDIGAGLEEGMVDNLMGRGTRLLEDLLDRHISKGLTKEDLATQFPAISEEGLEQLHDSLLGELRRREREGYTAQADAHDINPLLRFVLNAAGSVSPVDILPLGAAKTFVGRLLSGAGFNAAADVGMQAQDMAYGAQDEYNPQQTLMNAAAGAAIQGGLEGAVRGGQAIVNRVTGRNTPTNAPQPVEPTPEPNEPIPVEELGFLKNPVKAKGYGSSKPRANKPKAKSEQRVEPAQLEDSGRGQNLREVETQVQELTSGWTNAPEFLIVNNVDDLDDNLAAAITADQAEGALGVTLPDGRVLLMTDNIGSKAEVEAVTFHEALGHVGLNTEYRDGLDGLLLRMDEGNDKLRETVDDWMAQSPEAYGGNRARAIEEVLAEGSEGGMLSKTAMDQIRIFFSKMARRLGIKDKGYFGDAEIREILRMGHERIVNGEKGIAGIDGSRYIRTWHASRADFDEFSDLSTDEGRIERNLYMKNTDRVPSKLKWNPGKQKQRGMIGNISGNRIKSKRAVHPVIQEAADLAEDFTPESFALWDQKAREMDMGLDEIRNLNKGLSPEEAHAVGIALVTKGEKVERLAGLIARGEATDKQKTNFGEAFLELATIYEEYAKIANNAGRLLASFKIAKQSSSNESLRFMREDAEAAMRSDEGIEGLARDIASGKKRAGKAVRETSTTVDALSNALNLPRTLMSSFDVSAPLRQGVVLVGTLNFWKAFFKMFHYMGSDRAYKALNDSIMQHPNYMKMREAGLSLTTTEGHRLDLKEEDFQSEWAKKIWGIGKGVEMSERAFVGFLNKLRSDTFNTYMRDFERAGHDINDPKLLKGAASFINAATGRGPIPKKYAGATPLLNGLFFSPRLITSRVTLLNPVYYGMLPAPVRKKAVLSMLGFTGIAMTTATLAVMGGFDVELDPRSSDFLKLRDGTKRFDTMGGFSQFITLGARLITGQTKRISGDVHDLGPGMVNDSGWDVLVKFARNKASPLASWVIDNLHGEDPIGKRVSNLEPLIGTPPEGEDPIKWYENAVVSRLLPIYVQDVIDVGMKEGIEGLPYLLPSAFGIGYSDFDSVPDESAIREENNPDDPGVQEVTRLALATDKKIIGNPGKKVNLEGDGLPSRELTEDEYARYVELSDEFILMDINETINHEDYDLLTDSEKAEWLNDTANKARADARETLAAELYGEDARDEDYEEPIEEGTDEGWTRIN